MKRQSNCDKEDLWFLPPLDDDEAQSKPWPVAAREASLEPDVWRAAEKECFRELVAAVQALVRFGERLKRVPSGIQERFAIDTVSAVLQSEGTWIGPEQIALYRTLRTVSGDHARDLARASWAVRRLLTDRDPTQGDLHAFLGRTEVELPRQLPGDERPLGDELVALGDRWAAAVERLGDCHRLTRAAFGFALWRAEGISPYEDVLEPTIAALAIGARGMAPILPVGQGHRFDRHGLKPGAAGATERLKVFFRAAEAGALAATLELDRLIAWQERALDVLSDLSGRTPPLMVAAFLKARVVSAEWLAAEVGGSPVSARRNLKVFDDRGLVREVTGQERYRFWTAAL